MFFDNLNQLPNLAASTNCAIFVMPKDTKINLKNSFTLSPPEDKQTISIEQIRDFTANTNTKQTENQFLIINPADSMTEAAENAFLKNLEEPSSHIHYLLITDKPYLLLPTILSRSQIFHLKTNRNFEELSAVSDDVKKTAKSLITITSTELPKFADSLSKHKDARSYTLKTIATAIEMLYKSYFKTENPKFLQKIPNLLTLYENIQNNGHIKLHLVADLC